MLIAIIDLETTGFLQKGGKIVEIGIVSLDLTNGHIEKIYDKVVHEKGITREEVEESWIVKNSTLTVEDVRRSPSLNSVFTEVQNIIKAFPLGITAYNNSFDFGFMESRGFDMGKKLPCPMLLSVDVCKIPNVRGGRGYKWPKVQEAWDYFFGKETGYIEQHRGCDDAYHEAKIVYELYKLGIFKI